MKLTQKQRILKALRDVKSGQHDIPSEFILHRSGGDGVSGRYFRRELWINECNARITELGDDGYVIEDSTTRDAFRFKYHRLISEPAPKQLSFAA